MGRKESETYVISITSSKWFAIAQNKSKNLRQATDKPSQPTDSCRSKG